MEKGAGMDDRTFVYDQYDLNHAFGVSTSDITNGVTLNFDDLLVKTWEIAQSNAVSNYELKIECRRVPGPLGIVAQLNTQRTSNRRKPQVFNNVSLPFNPDQFNFTKIKQNELLFNIYKKDGHSRTLVGSCVVNVSPFAKCHSLIVPDPNSCRPQIMAVDGIKLALELQALSRNKTLVTVFNSMCGQASVNHLHLHCYYMPKINDEKQHVTLPMLQQTFTKTLKISKNCVLCKELPVPAFMFTISSADDITLTAYDLTKITDYFVEKDIAHNVVIIKSKDSTTLEAASEVTFPVIRVFLWARKKLHDIKADIKMAMGACELAGHVFTGEKYHSLSEDGMLKVYDKVRLQDSVFQQIVQDVEAKLN
uniref:GDP-D-glucose phosphorylase 1-like n=1 Tax=Ciona intestinalis TaxID=7719 RepID=UPI000180CB81|nr:GDP-D-glucose phosphorylase 1-like [Ciona intestinalis]|eukprot:XP_002131802.1 GDP-D-glucose phosphorylase 1-like [Ciona intestinalis]